MPNHLIKIEKIYLKDLKGFIQKALSDPAFKEVLPISKRRAFSQTNNPYGHPDDIALLVAYFDKRCVGYFGLVPGLLHQGGRSWKVYYASTFLVSPDMRSKGLGHLILNELINLKVDIVLTGMTKSAKRTYDRIGFKTLGNLKHYQLRLMRINFLNAFFAGIYDALENRLPKLANIIPLMKKMEGFIYRLSKRLLYGWVLYRKKNIKKAFCFSQVNEIKKEFFKPRPFNASSGFIRKIEAVNWMLKHPWIVSSSGEDKPAENYFFSSVRDVFKYVALEIYSADPKTAKGFLILSVSRHKNKTVVKLLDFSIPSVDLEWAVFLTLQYAQSYLADLIEYPVEVENYFRKIWPLRPLIKRRKRLYLFQPKSGESPLNAAAKNISLNYCDSDTAFI